MSQDLPKFSIIVVCYNEAGRIAATLKSCIGQDYANREIIVVDGASDDGSVELIQSFADHLHAFSSEPDRGIYDAMNRGLGMASGDFVCFMNGGDAFFDESVLSSVAGKIGSNRGTTWVGRSRVTADTEEWDVPPKDVNFGQWAHNGVPHHQAVFYPRSFALQNRYDMTIGHAADTDFTLLAFENCGFAFADVTVARFFLGGASNNFRRFSSAWKATQTRLNVIRRHPGWFSVRFTAAYLIGPLAACTIYKTLGASRLEKMRQKKSKSAITDETIN